jgi:hypothetical protein
MEVHENPLSRLSYEEIKGLLGTIIDNDIVGDFAEPTIINGLPTDFDGRDQWGACVHPIRD